MAVAKTLAQMLLNEAIGISFCVGQHLFYKALNGTTPPTTKDHRYHPLVPFSTNVEITQQQLNTFAGNALAFAAKVFLALAVSAAHEQIIWRTIRRRPRELGLIDTLVNSRESVFSALNVRMWWQMPLPTLLLFTSW